MSTSEPLRLPKDLAARIEERLAEAAVPGLGAEDVLRAGLDALDAQDERRLALVREKLDRAMVDPQPSRPSDEVFDRVQAVVNALRHS